MKFFNFYQNFIRDKRGFTLIEAAIVLPVLVLFAFGVLEAALALQQKAAVTRAVKAIGASLQENPAQAVDATLWSGLDVGWLNFAPGGNACVCATVHATAAEAEAAAENRGCPCASTNTNQNVLVRPFFLGVSASATLPAATNIGGSLFGNPRVLQSHTVLSFPVGQEDCYIIHTTTLMDPSDSETGFFIKNIKYAWPWGYGGALNPNPDFAYFSGPPWNMGTASTNGGGGTTRSCPKGTLVTGMRIDYGAGSWSNGAQDLEFADQGVAELTCKPSIPIQIELCAKGNVRNRPNWWNPKTDATMHQRIKCINGIGACPP
jgi:Flp pilus assembly protein TadG